MTEAKTTRDYAVEATKYIISLEKSLDECAGRHAAILVWEAQVRKSDVLR